MIECSERCDESVWPFWLRWCPSSSYLAILAETRLLNRVNSVKEIFVVPVLNKCHLIRTLYVYKDSFVNQEEKDEYFGRVPIVLVHGLGAGLAMWCKNLDSLAQNRQVYAFDVLGFANSSRPSFPNDRLKVETMFVQSIEDWRSYIGMKKFVILGHSLGGYISFCYAVKYGNFLTHIILADPWGFRECKDSLRAPFKMSWTLNIFSFLFKFFNPLFPVRLLGPFAPYLLRMVRQDLGITFQPSEISLTVSRNTETSVVNEVHGDSNIGTQDTQNLLLKQTESDLNAIFDYIYHCNTKYPSGESAFKYLSFPIGWAAHPLIQRINDLDSKIKITFIYGGKSWMDWQTGYQAQHLRLNSSVDVKVIDGAGHHVYAEASDDFNDYVNEICEASSKSYNVPRPFF